MKNILHIYEHNNPEQIGLRKFSKRIQLTALIFIYAAGILLKKSKTPRSRIKAHDHQRSAILASRFVIMARCNGDRN